MTGSIHFNTGFVYRYSQTGIIKFGGEYGPVFEFNTIRWKNIDISLAYKELKKLQIEQQLPIVNFTSYLKNKEGTAKMLSDLLIKGVRLNEYLLGCVIYHQLTYKVPLRAYYLIDYINENYNSDDYCNTASSYSDEGSE
jgi:hypothetical protein